jgi:hypothetical protein
MSIKERITAKIDLKDALFGGISIYVTVLLILFTLIFGTDLALRIFGFNADSTSGMLVASLLAFALITFFVVVLFEETFFSKHEKGFSDLLGLGLIWGMVFISLDALVETFVMYIYLFQGWESYSILSVRSIIYGFPYWIIVGYIVCLPAAIYYLRKNHKEFMEKK